MSTSEAGEATRPLPRGTCPRCGTAWVGRLGGRPRKWCSQACRRSAYEERRAAANGAIAVRGVEQGRAVEHDLSTCVERVAESPTAVKRLFRSLMEPTRIGDIATELRWEPTRNELLKLVDQMALELTRTGPKRWP